MEKQLKTYGVYGMMEYQAVIKVGSKTAMKINFTDGSLTAMGTNPARYSTDKYMVQHAIENSHDYKRGLIKLISTVPLGGEVKIERNAPVSAPISAPAPATPADAPAVESTGFAQVEGDTSDIAADAVESAATTEAETAPADSSALPLGSAKKPTDAPNEDGVKQVVVHCNDDAKDYLADNCGVVRGKLRNRADIMEAAAANGVEFIFE